MRASVAAVPGIWLPVSGAPKILKQLDFLRSISGSAGL